MMREDQEIIYWEQNKDKSNKVKGEKKKRKLYSLGTSWNVWVTYTEREM